MSVEFRSLDERTTKLAASARFCGRWSKALRLSIRTRIRHDGGRSARSAPTERYWF